MGEKLLLSWISIVVSNIRYRNQPGDNRDNARNMCDTQGWQKNNFIITVVK